MVIKYGKDEVDNLKWDNAAARVIEVYNRAQTLLTKNNTIDR